MKRDGYSCRVAVEQMEDVEVRYALNYLAGCLDAGEMPRISTYDLIFNQPEVWKKEASE